VLLDFAALEHGVPRVAFCWKQYFVEPLKLVFEALKYYGR
jgi:hypothetical protein